MRKALLSTPVWISSAAIARLRSKADITVQTAGQHSA
jgi:hypothetical protein